MIDMDNFIWYAGHKMKLKEILVEDENENWDDRKAQLLCNQGGCVIHEGKNHGLYEKVKEEPKGEIVDSCRCCGWESPYMLKDGLCIDCNVDHSISERQ